MWFGLIQTSVQRWLRAKNETWHSRHTTWKMLFIRSVYICAIYLTSRTFRGSLSNIPSIPVDWTKKNDCCVCGVYNFVQQYLQTMYRNRKYQSEIGTDVTFQFSVNANQKSIRTTHFLQILAKGNHFMLCFFALIVSKIALISSLWQFPLPLCEDIISPLTPKGNEKKIIIIS